MILSHSITGRRMGMSEDSRLNRRIFVSLHYISVNLCCTCESLLTSLNPSMSLSYLPSTPVAAGQRKIDWRRHPKKAGALETAAFSVWLLSLVSAWSCDGCRHDDGGLEPKFFASREFGSCLASGGVFHTPPFSASGSLGQSRPQFLVVSSAVLLSSAGCAHA